MSNWFDSYARRSARRDVAHHGMTRRQMLVRGSLTAGAAWAAPTLISSPAYAFGVSGCADANVCGTNAAEQQRCCSNAFQCTRTTGNNVCVTTSNAPGGNCGTSIGGTCTGNTACSTTGALGQCGGQGATCQGSAVCASGFTAVGSGSNCTCRRQCSTSNPCPGALTCSSSSNGTCS